MVLEVLKQPRGAVKKVQLASLQFEPVVLIEVQVFFMNERNSIKIPLQLFKMTCWEDKKDSVSSRK